MNYTTLIEALTTARIQEWEAHLFDVVEAELARMPLVNRNHQEKRLRLYSILEVQEVSAIMESPPPYTTEYHSRAKRWHDTLWTCITPAQGTGTLISSARDFGRPRICPGMRLLNEYPDAHNANLRGGRCKFAIHYRPYR